MPRNDALLNTGMSSALERRRAAIAERKKQERERKRSALQPGADIILTWIDQEMAECTDVRKLVMNISTEQNAQAELLAIRKHIEFLVSLKARAQNILRVHEEAKGGNNE